MDERARSRRVLTLRDGVAIALALLVVPIAALAGLGLPIHSSGVLAPIFSAPATPVGQVGTTSSEAISFPPATRDENLRRAGAPSASAWATGGDGESERRDDVADDVAVRAALRDPSPALAPSASRVGLGGPKAAGNRGPVLPDRDEPAEEPAPPVPGAPITPDPAPNDDPGGDGGADRPTRAAPRLADEPGSGIEPPEAGADDDNGGTATTGPTGTTEGDESDNGQPPGAVTDPAVPGSAPGPGKGKGKPKKGDPPGAGGPSGSAPGAVKPKQSAKGGPGS